MLRFGTVGTGWIVDSYITGALETGLWQLAAVYSRREETGRAFAEKYPGPPQVYTDLAAMAESPGIDAVYIASPNRYHTEQARVFLEHGKHVICEKPLSAHPEEVRAVQALAREKGLVFMEAIMYMHLPQRARFEDALRRIGDVSLAKIDFCQRSSKYDAYLAGEVPNIFNPALETGALMDLGVYCVYPALHLFGEPESVQAAAHFLTTGADGSGAALFQYKDKLVDLVYSKLGQAAANTDFQGTYGTVSVGSISRLAEIEIVWNSGEREKIHGEDPKPALMGYEAKDLYRYITEPEATREDYLTCAEMSLRAAEMLEKIRKKAGIEFT